MTRTLLIALFLASGSAAQPPRPDSLVSPEVLPGNRVTFRYAVVLHAGDPAAADLAGLYKAWAAKPV